MYSGPIINIHTHLRLTDDLPARLANWRKWNVQKAVCLSVHERWRTQGYCVNRDYPAIMRQYPDMIVPFAAVNLVANQIDQPEAVDRFKEQGFIGLKFEDNSYPYNHDIYWPLYDRAEKLKMPILFHTGWLSVITADSDGRDRIDSENMRPYLLDRVARAFPQLKMIGAHLGKPHCQEALSVMECYPNLYFDFSGGSGGKRHVRAIIAALMPPLAGSCWDDPEENPALKWFAEKLLFGTDNPEPDIWVPASEFIMDALHIPPDVRSRFYCQTAASLFGWRI